ncbi:YoaK family protein [Streptomyces sp. NPDC055287]
MQPQSGAVLVPLAVALTVTTGMIEAVSLLSLGPVFTAMQTGNVLFLAFGVVGEGGLSMVAPCTSLGAFAVGTVIGARMESMLESRRQRWFSVALYVEALLITAAAFGAWGLERAEGTLTGRHAGVTAVLALAMGIRGVTTMRASVPDVPTTLVTRAMTALLGGSPLGHDAALGYGSRAWARRSASVLAMFTGGLIGASMLHSGRPVTLVLLSAAVVVLVVATIRISHARLRTR